MGVSFTLKWDSLDDFVESNQKGTFELGKCISQTQINLAQFDRQVISYLSYNSEITDSIYCSAVGW